MKIAFVVHDFQQGLGHGRYCIELARRFSPAHEIHILANTFDSDLDFPFQKHFVRAYRKTALTSVLTFPAAAQKILDRENFDLVHAQGYACHRADVITAHICNAARYKITPAKSLLKKLFPALVIPRERAFYQNAKAREIIAISKVIQRELAHEYGSRSSVIYHGIDTNDFKPSQRKGADRWLFVGEAVKGLEQAIRALAQFPSAYLTVISRSDLTNFQYVAHTLGVADRIKLHGTAKNLPSFYREADLFIYPSEYDAFGLVVAEAMASGLPVVVGKNIGAAEWINDGENGFLCDPHDVSSIVSQINRAAQNPDAGNKACATALNYTWDLCAKNTMAIYERAISSKRASQ